MKEKAKPDLSPAQLRKLGTMFLMRRFPKQVQSDVLSDGQVAKSAGLIITHPIKLAEGHTFERKLIFGALRKLADKRKVPTSLPSVSRARVKVRLSAKGNDGFIRIGKADIRVPNAMLLTSSIGRRKSTLATCLRKHTLDLEQLDKLERLVAKRTLSDDDFVAIGGILAASPESFADALRERAKTGRLDKADFLPDATVYWSNLVASRKTSETLPDYLANELAIRQKALLLADPVAGLDMVSLSFGAPELVPLATLKQVEADDLVRAIEHLFEIGDPFAIAGAFAICAEWVQSDPRFAALGDKALECLFKDPERLLLQFATYGAAFVIATAYLSEHEVFQREAVFWRRVAAATHAAVVARTLVRQVTRASPC